MRFKFITSSNLDIGYIGNCFIRPQEWQENVDTLKENKATPFGVGAVVEECVCLFFPSICEAFGKQQEKNPHMTLLRQCGGVVCCTRLCGNFGFLKWCGLALCQFKLDYHYQQQKTPVCLEKKYKSHKKVQLNATVVNNRTLDSYNIFSSERQKLKHHFSFPI